MWHCHGVLCVAVSCVLFLYQYGFFYYPEHAGEGCLVEVAAGDPCDQCSSAGDTRCMCSIDQGVGQGRVWGEGTWGGDKKGSVS